MQRSDQIGHGVWRQLPTSLPHSAPTLTLRELLLRDHTRKSVPFLWLAQWPLPWPENSCIYDSVTTCLLRSIVGEREGGRELKSDQKPKDRLSLLPESPPAAENVVKRWVKRTINRSDNCKTRSSPLIFLGRLFFLLISLPGARLVGSYNPINLSYFSFTCHPLIPPLSSGHLPNWGFLCEMFALIR